MGYQNPNIFSHLYKNTAKVSMDEIDNAVVAYPY
jgi:hypothetical protein